MALNEIIPAGQATTVGAGLALSRAMKTLEEELKDFEKAESRVIVLAVAVSVLSALFLLYTASLAL